MMINLWVVRFEDAEVKQMWEKTKQKTEVVAAYVLPATDRAVHATLSATETVLRKTADGVIIAADYIKDLDEPVAKRVRAYQMAKEAIQKEEAAGK